MDSIKIDKFKNLPPHSLLQESLAPVNKLSFNHTDSLHDKGLIELKGHIHYLKELNGRLKLIISEIHSLITLR